MSVIIFVGQARLFFLELFVSGASPFLISSTVGVVNLRHALFGKDCTLFQSPDPWLENASILSADG